MRAGGPTLAVDARALHGSGIGRYTREVVARLVERGRFAAVRLVGARAELEPFVATLAGGTPLEIVAIRGGRYSPLAQVAWARLGARRRIADVVFFPHWDVPLVRMPRASVVTIHDLILVNVRGATSPARRAVARAMLSRAVKGAARLIADSECTRSDLLASYPGAADRVTVVPLGVSARFAGPVPPLSALPPRVRPPYLLCVANRKSHKNLGAAVRVLAHLHGDRPALTLAVAGERFPSWTRTLRLAKALGVGDRIVDLDAMPDEQLRALYAHAAAYLHPSRHEGFGLPILEAMACGAPVVASNASAIPEVAGGAALLCGPDDIDGLSEAVARLLDDAAARERAVALGRRHARAFTWSRTVEATERVLLEAAGP